LFKALSTLTGKKPGGPAAARAGSPSNKPQPPPPARAGGKGGAKQASSGSSGDGLGDVRLNKLLAHAGAAPSRRAAEAMIGEGRVSVNGAVVTDVGHKVDPGRDKVVADGKPVGGGAKETRKGREAVWLKLHKPKGALAALTDARGRKCLSDLVPDAAEKGLQPVGRLGLDAAGLLLLTDDREGAHLLADRSLGVVRVYKVVVEKGMPSPQALAALAKGIVLEAVEEDEEDEGGDRRRGRGGGSRGRGGPQQQQQQQQQQQRQGVGERLLPMTVQCVDYFADRKEAVLEVCGVHASG
jgi:16S rRNA U516 pseudouridylate synthase RsuA-like enzyme